MASQIEMNRRTGIVQKIPMFAGLSLHQIQQVLKAANLENPKKGTILFRKGEKSKELYILLSGELTIQDDGLELARITPVDIVGEMGVLTEEPRSASVHVSKESTLLSLNKLRFDMLMKNDVVMSAQIYRNMLDSLIYKLRANNERQRVGAY